MKSKPLLSIITCTYNSEKYLKDCINSVIAQNLEVDEYEHIFIDANSTDNTKKIISDYQKKYNNVKILEYPPKWVYNAMNNGITNSSWEYLLFLNSDDFLEKNIMRKYLDYANLYKADIFYWKMYLLKNWKKINWSNYIVLRKILWFLWFHCLFWHPTTLIKKSLFEEVWYYDEKYKISSDYWFWIKSLKAHKRFKYFPFFVSNFRISDSSISANNKDKSILEMSDIRKKVFWIYWKILDILWRLVNSLTWRYF